MGLDLRHTFVSALTLVVLMLGMVREVKTQVTISELMINPVTNGNVDEWIELENIGAETVNLERWVLDDVLEGGSGAYTLGPLVIEPGGFVVLEYALTKVALNDSGDTVHLLGDNGSVLETVSYDKHVGKSEGKTWSRFKKSDGTIEYALSEPTKGLANASLTEPVSSPNPSPTLTVSVEGVHFSEIKACPASDETEWLEIYNNSSTDLRAVAASIKDATGNTKQIVISAPMRGFQVFEWTNGFLNNTGDSLRLFDAQGALIDELEYHSCSTRTSLAAIDGTWKETVRETKGFSNIFEPLPLPTSAPTLVLKAKTENESEALTTVNEHAQPIGVEATDERTTLGLKTGLEESETTKNAGELRSVWGNVNPNSSVAGGLNHGKDIIIDAPDYSPRPWILVGGVGILTGGLLLVRRGGLFKLF